MHTKTRKVASCAAIAIYLSASPIVPVLAEEPVWNIGPRTLPAPAPESPVAGALRGASLSLACDGAMAETSPKVPIGASAPLMGASADGMMGGAGITPASMSSSSCTASETKLFS